MRFVEGKTLKELNHVPGIPNGRGKRIRKAAGVGGGRVGSESWGGGRRCYPSGAGVKKWHMKVGFWEVGILFRG
jgi:hypothetical protein